MVKPDETVPVGHNLFRLQKGAAPPAGAAAPKPSAPSTPTPSAPAPSAPKQAAPSTPTPAPAAPTPASKPSAGTSPNAASPASGAGRTETRVCSQDFAEMMVNCSLG